MANSDDLTYGHGRDEALEAVRAQMPGQWFVDSDLTADMLAVILLDQHYGVRRDGDYVYLNPAYLWAILPLQIKDPVIARAMHAGEDEDEQVIIDANERMTAEPFDVLVAYDPTQYEGGDVPEAETLPAALRGQTIRVRVMKLEDAGGDLPAIMTVRADGEVIRLPGRGNTGLIRSIPAHIR